MKPIKEGYDTCFACGQKNPNSSRAGYNKKSISDFIIPSFYVSEDSEVMNPEIFTTKSRDLALQLEASQKSVRNLLNILLSAEWSMRTRPDERDNKARETFARFVMFTERQVKRGVLPPDFAEFARQHEPVVKNAREFKGFVEYLRAIYAYLPKSK